MPFLRPNIVLFIQRGSTAYKSYQQYLLTFDDTICRLLIMWDIFEIVTLLYVDPVNVYSIHLTIHNYLISFLTTDEVEAKRLNSKQD